MWKHREVPALRRCRAGTRGRWGGQSFGVGVLGRTAWPDLAPPVPPLPIHASTPPQSGKSPPVLTLSFVFHSLCRRFTAASPHPGRHLDLANQTCPACSGRRVVWRGCLQTAALLAAQGSWQLRSQRVALPAGEEPRPLPDLRLIFPRCLSWNPSPICIEGLVLPTSGRPHPGQGESSMAWRR